MVRFQSDEAGDGRPAVTDSRELMAEHFRLVAKERSISGCFQVKETRWVFREEG